MTKEEYREKIRELNEARKNLDRQYIDSQRKFADGQKIIVVRPQCTYRNPKTGKETAYPERRINAYLKCYRIDFLKLDLIPEIVQEYHGRPSQFPLKIMKNDLIIAADHG